jgi:hypothetical protein
MLPAPARIASTPRQNSRTCWNPAVPPPPVPGAGVGKVLADGLGDGGGLGLAAAAWGVAALDVAALGVAALGVAALGVLALGVVALGVLVLGVLLEAVALGVPLAVAVGVAGPVPPGEKGGGVVGGEAPLQADTEAAANRAKAAQPRTVRRKRRRPSQQDQRALRARNGLFITVISGYAGRTP